MSNVYLFCAFCFIIITPILSQKSKTHYSYNEIGARIDQKAVEYSETLAKQSRFINNIQTLKDTINDFDIKIYPNPTKGDIIIQLLSFALSEEVIHCKLYNDKGELIFSNNFLHHLFIINIKERPNGYYILQLKYNQKEKKIKILKE